MLPLPRLPGPPPCPALCRPPGAPRGPSPAARCPAAPAPRPTAPAGFCPRRCPGISPALAGRTSWLRDGGRPGGWGGRATLIPPPLSVPQLCHGGYWGAEGGPVGRELWGAPGCGSDSGLAVVLLGKLRYSTALLPTAHSPPYPPFCTPQPPGEEPRAHTEDVELCAPQGTPKGWGFAPQPAALRMGRGTPGGHRGNPSSAPRADSSGRNPMAPLSTGTPSDTLRAPPRSVSLAGTPPPPSPPQALPGRWPGLWSLPGLCPVLSQGLRPRRA